MRCPFCKEVNQDKVIDSRLSEGGDVIRRRRMCLACDKRFTTKERVETDVKLMVVKADGTRVPYERNKILAGLQRACYKRPVEEDVLVDIVDKVEDVTFKHHDREVSSHFIGSVVCQHLRSIDQIAYVRFASVYRRFEDIGELIDEARQVRDHGKTVTEGQQDLFE